MAPGTAIPDEYGTLPTVDIVGITEGDDNGTPCILAYDAEGNLYVCYNPMTYTSAYGKLLKSKTGTTGTAWMNTPKNDSALATEHDLIFIYPATNGENPYDENAAWFARHGVEIGVFVNP